MAAFVQQVNAGLYQFTDQEIMGAVQAAANEPNLAQKQAITMAVATAVFRLYQDARNVGQQAMQRVVELRGRIERCVDRDTVTRITAELTNKINALATQLRTAELQFIEARQNELRTGRTLDTVKGIGTGAGGLAAGGAVICLATNPVGWVVMMGIMAAGTAGMLKKENDERNKAHQIAQWNRVATLVRDGTELAVARRQIGI